MPSINPATGQVTSSNPALADAMANYSGSSEANTNKALKSYIAGSINSDSGRLAKDPAYGSAVSGLRDNFDALKGDKGLVTTDSLKNFLSKTEPGTPENKQARDAAQYFLNNPASFTNLDTANDRRKAQAPNSDGCISFEDAKVEAMDIQRENTTETSSNTNPGTPEVKPQAVTVNGGGQDVSKPATAPETVASAPAPEVKPQAVTVNGGGQDVSKPATAPLPVASAPAPDAATAAGNAGAATSAGNVVATVGDTTAAAGNAGATTAAGTTVATVATDTAPKPSAGTPVNTADAKSPADTKTDADAAKQKQDDVNTLGSPGSTLFRGNHSYATLVELREIAKGTDHPIADVYGRKYPPSQPEVDAANRLLAEYEATKGKGGGSTLDKIMASDEKFTRAEMVAMKGK
jgi:hypothetical protein